ncbi:MAG: autotransporter outer membrane beta-barrel domain-containing protein, partial [Candidatus Accumulibacter sp.]|nr:autotransporter outer membrane beta-barrel domain-containing protein [Accumulibacter sp.]
EFVNYGGREIAVYIGPHAHVDSINILNGATLRGDIISRWDPEKHDLPASPPNGGMSSLTFGLEKNADGSAAATPDNAFDLDYRGNITGAASLKVSLEGGTLRYAGAVDAHSFEMKGSTTLLADFVGGNPTRISAETISLQTGSAIGFNPAAFAYGKRLEVGPNPLLTFNSGAGGLDYNATLKQSAGAFAVGPYDYTYNGLLGGADGVRVATTSRAFNHQRGGSDAVSAPLAIAARNPGLDFIQDRMVRLFSNPDTAGRGSAGEASALLGALRMADFHQGGAAFNGGAWNRFTHIAHAGAADALGAVPSDRNKPYSDELRTGAEQLPLGNGVRETGTGRGGVWMAPSYSRTRHRGSRDFDVRGSGFAAGVDFRLTDSWSLGAAVALDFPRYDSDDAQVSARSISGFLYSGIRLPLELELALSASFGESHFKQKREVAGAHYSSSFEGRTTGLGMMLGRRFQLLDKLVLRPFAAVDYSYIERLSHNEGGGATALHYNSVQNSIHHLRAGADLAFVFDGGFLSARAYWSGRRGDTQEHGRTYFTQDPEHNSFIAPVDGLDRNSLGLAASVAYRLGQSVYMTAEYSRLGGHHSTTHQGMLGLRMWF